MTSPILVAASPPTRWRDLRIRLISAAVLAPVGLACLWFGGAAWLVLVVITTVGLAVEWVQLCGRLALSPTGLVVAFGVLAAVGAAAFGAAGVALLVLAGAALLVGLLLAAPLGLLAGTIFALGVPYVGVPAVALIWLRADPIAGTVNAALTLVIVWASDIGAYGCGRLIGGPRLAPAISPGKTWSGAVGGLLAAMLTGWLLAWAVGGHEAGPGAVLVAGGLSAVAQAGDLLESLIKRRFGVKDSGRLIPGHGGLFDRLDGVLTAAPAAALLALMLGRGVILWE